jgi:hypothetical protein
VGDWVKGVCGFFLSVWLVRLALACDPSLHFTSLRFGLSIPCWLVRLALACDPSLRFGLSIPCPFPLVERKEGVLSYFLED